MPVPNFSVPGPVFNLNGWSQTASGQVTLYDQVYGQPVGPQNPLYAANGVMSPPAFSSGDPIIPGAPPAFVQNGTGTGATITYYIVGVNWMGQDTMPSAVISVPNNAATPDNTLYWLPCPGAAYYKVIKNGNLLATVGAGAFSTSFAAFLTYRDSAGATGSAYTAVTANPPNVIAVGAVQSDNYRQTYRYGMVALQGATNATDILTLSGSATKIVKVRRFQIAGVATAAAIVDCQCIVRTTANSGGTSTAPTGVAIDQNNAAATAVLALYTANPAALGTAAGVVDVKKLPIPATPGLPPTVNFDFGQYGGQPVVLRGVAQSFCVNLNASNVTTGQSLNGVLEWTEE